MGKPNTVYPVLRAACGTAIPAEVKHLSKRRKRKQAASWRNIPSVAASEQGIAQTRPHLIVFDAEITNKQTPITNQVSMT